MSLLFFSGGIDSTVLLTDMTKNPHRYAIGEGERLYVVTYGKESVLKKRRKQLKPIIDHVSKKSAVRIVQKFIPSSLIGIPANNVPHEGQNLQPSIDGDAWQKTTMPFTPGLYIALAGVAVNILGTSNGNLSDLDSWPYIGYFGFQYSREEYERADNDNDAYNDTSPAFIAKMNDLVKNSILGIDIRFRAPYLEARMTKEHIVKMGLEIGAPLHLSSSCIQGFGVDCGYCCHCLRRAALRASIGAPV